MAYELITKFDSPNFTNRRITPKYIVIHWWDDPSRHPTFDGVIATFMNPARQASAHYVAEAGRVACLVDPDVMSWATGPANSYTISIECNPRQSDGDYQTIGELVADIRKTYGNLPLKRHRDFMNTACPGTYDIARIDRIAHGQTNKPSATAPAPVKPAPAPTHGFNPATDKLDVDGDFARKSVLKLQWALGTRQDGVISGQLVPDGVSYARPNLNSSVVQYGGGGSDVIRALQRYLAAHGWYHGRIDGLAGPGTITGMHHWLGLATPANRPWTSWGPGLSMGAQRKLNEGKLS